MIWSLGATVAQTLFDGVRRHANLGGTRANYEATVAYCPTAQRGIQVVNPGT